MILLNTFSNVFLSSELDWLWQKVILASVNSQRMLWRYSYELFPKHINYLFRCVQFWIGLTVSKSFPCICQFSHMSQWTLYSIVYIIHWISFQMCFSVLICIVLGQKLALQLSLLIACSNKHSTGPLPHKYCSFSTSSKRGRGLSPCTALPPLNDVVEHHVQSFSFKKKKSDLFTSKSETQNFSLLGPKWRHIFLPPSSIV